VMSSHGSALRTAEALLEFFSKAIDIHL